MGSMAGQIALNVLRWTLFIPSGILAGALSNFLSYYVFGILNWIIGLPFDSPLNRMATAGVLGCCMITAAAFTAPKGPRALAAIIMAVITCLLFASLMAFVAYHHQWLLSAECAATIVGAVMSASLFWEQRTKRPVVVPSASGGFE